MADYDPKLDVSQSDALEVIAAEDYVSAEFARLEKERMWPKVWQVACREEKLKNVGDQLVYEICDESILVVRSAPDKISAFHNACPHRGRMLATGPRRTREFVCPFHGWRFDLKGKCTHIPYRDDWGDQLDTVDHGLTPVACDTWGGFVFVNPDSQAGPLRAYLGDAADRLDSFEFQNQRIYWTAAIELNCNWKVALEAFNEGYHVQTTHPQLLPVAEDRMMTFGSGLHGCMMATLDARLGAVSSLLKAPPPEDVRLSVVELMRQQAHDVRSIMTDRDLSASTRLLTELPANASSDEMGLALHRFRVEAAEAAGVGWPDQSLEQMVMGGAVWHIFPNVIVLTGPTASLWYRSRPLGKGTDPERCLFEFIALERYAPGFGPHYRDQYYTNFKDFADLPPLLAQDFDNLPYMQKGIRSRGFRGALMNPLQEQVIINFHKQLRKMIGVD